MIDGTFAAPRRASPARRSGWRTACGPAGDAVRLHATTTLGVTLGWGDQPEAGGRAAPRGPRVGPRSRRPRRAVPGLREPHDGPRPRSAGAARRSTSRTRASRRRGGPGSRRSSATSSAATPRTRCTCSAAGPSPARISATALEWSPGGVAFARPIDSLAIVEIETHAGEVAGRQLGQILRRARDGQRRPARGPDLPRRGVARALAGRPRRRRAGGRARLGAREGRRRLEPDREDGRDRRRGRFGGRRRRDGPARPGRPGRDPGAVAGRPEGGPSGRRAVARRGDGRVAARGRRLARPGERPSRAPRGPRRPGELGPARRALDGARQPVRAGEGPLAPGRGDPRLRRGPAGPGSRAGAARGGGPHRRRPRRPAAPPRGPPARRAGDDPPPAARRARAGFGRRRRRRGRQRAEAGALVAVGPGRPTGSTDHGAAAAAVPATVPDRRTAPGPRMRDRPSSAESSATPRPRAGTRSGSRIASARSSR